ncbi:hypothetical protein BN1232_06304 [Mycobacterium lentiflavum]|uniref:DUF2637 domain-containing protein n=2 Tax=Mycobacterium simiae complex TaxID=2249310 RepID=A0A0E3WED9_MYCLN|nr:MULTISPECIES: DUF2637 domain-containing protein [Mycobacterium simiae complex]ORJ52680.1 hypothetical protein B5M45_30265 [Mycobacterium simiae]ULP45404.1 DUF2637 domain-containing protein [Mycobacterium lentiflavum]CQD24642.1 hypothetical protein BN1232_06304 [Mycobacterium lentiflavum]
MACDSARDDLADIDLQTQRRAVRFFWVVLIGASAASIAGNALHAIVQAEHVAPVLAAAVATAPPLVLLGSTEGLSLLIKVHRRPTLTFWAALIMTLLLGAGAFRLSFDALCSLAIRCGIRPTLAWLWPLIIDVTTAQATVALVALTRLQHSRVQAPAALDEETEVWLSATDLPLGEASAGDRDSTTGRVDAAQSLSSVPRADPVVPTRERHDRAVRTVMASKKTKQPPEVIDAVLRRHADGQRPGEISEGLKLHHTTVNRILATALHSATAV